MSKIIHECTACGHRATWHGPSFASFTRCQCCKREMDPTNRGPSQLVDTYSARTHRPEPLHRPGSTVNAGTMSREVLCDCAECEALATDVTS